MVLAQVNNTPVGFWLSLRLSEFGGWIADSNFIQRDIEDRRKNK